MDWGICSDSGRCNWRIGGNHPCMGSCLVVQFLVQIIHPCQESAWVTSAMAASLPNTKPNQSQASPKEFRTPFCWREASDTSPRQTSRGERISIVPPISWRVGGGSFAQSTVKMAQRLHLQDARHSEQSKSRACFSVLFFLLEQIWRFWEGEVGDELIENLMNKWERKRKVLELCTIESVPCVEGTRVSYWRQWPTHPCLPPSLQESFEPAERDAFHRLLFISSLNRRLCRFGWRPKSTRIEFFFPFLLTCYSREENIPSLGFLKLQTLSYNLKIS